MEERYSFADSVTGLEHAFDTALHLRRHGYTTRLATRQWGKFTVHTVLATPPERPTRAQRGCNLGRTA